MENLSEVVPEKVLRAEKPLQKNVVRPFNLKNVFNKVEEERPEVEDFSGRPREEFTSEELDFQWNEFLAILLSENKIPTYNALHSGKVELKEDFQILFTFSSASSVSEFEIKKDRLMLFLRERFNNYSLRFQTQVIHNTSENYIKTKAQLFQEMATENPLLLKMKEEFGLDLNSND